MVMKHFFTFLTLGFLLSACGNDRLDYFDGRHGMWTPKPMYFGDLPMGDDDYSQGFRDGCNSALGTMTQGFMRSSFDDVYMDVNRNIAKDEYNKGWNQGHNYCTQFSDTDPI
jgi:hypothetical protein